MQSSERTFGIEIETHLPTEHAHLFPPGAAHHGIQVPHFPTGWTAQHDGSISRSGFHAVEVVSPVLTGEDGLTQVVYVVNNLAQLGAVPNEQCGMHVHIGVEDLTDAQIKAVKRAFIRYERAFYALSGDKAQTRVNNCYCKQSEYWQDDLGDRYRSLNLRNTMLARRHGSGKNTVEFRMWASTTVDTTVIAAISMAMALIAKVAAFGAATHPRIENERESIKEFVRNHFDTKHHYKIVDDAPIADIILHAWHEAKKACH